MQGIIVVNKPAGLTSAAVVSRLRRILSFKKIGHTGTLDPMATGVLPVCVGRATRLADLIQGCDKTYRAELVLGAETDTQDIYGKTLETSAADVSFDALNEACNSFTGEIMQLPPMYSALKKDGQPLYKLAREGKSVERTPRLVTIHSIKLMSAPQNGRCYIEVCCSKGTYIRTLCTDIARLLGLRGCMGSLVRIQAGGFGLPSALTLEDISLMAEQGDLTFLRPCDIALRGLKHAEVVPEFRWHFINGLDADNTRFSCPGLAEGELAAVYSDGLCGVGILKDGQLHLHIPLYGEE